MDIVQFIEEILDIKLLNYQKEMISYIEEHPDCKVIFPRTRRIPNWYMVYVISKAMKEENEHGHIRTTVSKG